jgi:hypothetical protein
LSLSSVRRNLVSASRFASTINFQYGANRGCLMVSRIRGMSDASNNNPLFDGVGGVSSALPASDFQGVRATPAAVRAAVLRNSRREDFMGSPDYKRSHSSTTVCCSTDFTIASITARARKPSVPPVSVFFPCRIHSPNSLIWRI